ncbi:hypothetical protein HC928_13545, partial [bacterium]|nr:hypothetical protein [bacterium]
MGYAYNGRGQRTGLTYPDGTALTYQYQADGRLDQVWAATELLADYDYDLNG